MKGSKILSIVFAAMGLCGIAGLSQRLSLRIAMFFAGKPAASHGISVGIIGGADGPTAVFVTAPGWTAYVVPVLLTVLGICGFLYFGKKRKD